VVEVHLVRQWVLDLELVQSVHLVDFEVGLVTPVALVGQVAQLVLVGQEVQLERLAVWVAFVEVLFLHRKIFQFGMFTTQEL